MFRALINDAKAAVGSLALQYLARASVAIPFAIALGFALAAITLMLIERYGSITAYWIMAAGLAVVGVVAAVLVSAKEQEQEIADEQAEESDTARVATEAAAQAIAQTPLALLGTLFTVPGGPNAALSAARTLGRNWPLVLLIAAIGALFWPAPDAEKLDGGEEAEDAEQHFKPAPDGADTMPTELRH